MTQLSVQDSAASGDAPFSPPRQETLVSIFVVVKMKENSLQHISSVIKTILLSALLCLPLQGCRALGYIIFPKNTAEVEPALYVGFESKFQHYWAAGQSIDYLADGSRIAVGDNQGTVRVYDVARREIVATLDDNTGGIIKAAAFSPDGRWLAAIHFGWWFDGNERRRQNMHIRLWDLQSPGTFKDIFTAKEGFDITSFCDAQFTANSETLICAFSENASLNPAQVLAYHLPTGQRVMAVAPKPEFPRIFPLMIQDAGPGEPISFLACGAAWSLQLHPRPALTQLETFPLAAMAIDLRRSLAYLGHDGVDHTGGRITAWDASIQVRRFPKGDRKAIWQVRRYGQTTYWDQLVLSPDGRWLAAASTSDVYLIDTQAARQIAVLVVSGRWANGANAVAFSPDGRFLAGACGGGLAIWDLRSIVESHRVK